MVHPSLELDRCQPTQPILSSTPMIRPLEAIENAVADLVAGEQFTVEELAAIRTEVGRALREMQAADLNEREALVKQLHSLEAQDERLIDLAADGTLNSAKLRERQEAVTLQKGALDEKLSRTAERIHHVVEKVFAYVDLLERPGDLYQGVPDTTRSDLLAALFSRINVNITDDDLTITSERTEVNATLHEWGLSAKKSGWNLDLAA